MSTMSPNADELMRMLTGTLELPNASSASPEGGTRRDVPKLEALVRLIARDEVQRHLPRVLADAPDTRVTDASDRPSRESLRNGVSDHVAIDTSSDAEVMSADDVATFLGVDRNTVYEYAGRGTIPCRRLGKRLLFHRPVLVSWLDPCRAALTRKA